MSRFFLLLCLCSLSVGAFVNNTNKIEMVKEIYFGNDIMDIREQSKGMTRMIIMRKPEWSQHQDLIQGHLYRVFSSDKYQSQIAEIIAKNFSHDELVELKKVMRSPVIVKWYKTMPQFMPELTIATNDHVMQALNDIVLTIYEN